MIKEEKKLKRNFQSMVSLQKLTLSYVFLFYFKEKIMFTSLNSNYPINSFEENRLIIMASLHHSST